MLTFIKDNALMILGAISIAFLILYGLYRVFTGSPGSWSASLNDVKAVAAPNLAPGKDSLGERRTRAFLESYFGRAFNKIRPEFLANDVTGGRKLEIDCYNADLHLGVEFNGRQHYEFVPFFHSSKEAFYNQKYRDKLKHIYCKERGITLVEIPYTEEARLEHFLEGRLVELGYERGGGSIPLLQS